MLGPAEAFAAIVLFVVAADGQLMPDEIELLDSTLSRMHLFQGYPVDYLQQTFAKLCDLLRSAGSEVVLTMALQALPRDLYDTTYAIALDLAYADGEVSPDERDLLNCLQAATGLPVETVTLLEQAMAIKHKG